MSNGAGHKGKIVWPPATDAWLIIENKYLYKQVIKKKTSRVKFILSYATPIP
jgi:hypothetical protein